MTILHMQDDHVSPPKATKGKPEMNQDPDPITTVITLQQANTCQGDPCLKHLSPTMEDPIEDFRVHSTLPILRGVDVTLHGHQVEINPPNGSVQDNEDPTTCGATTIL